MKKRYGLTWRLFHHLTGCTEALLNAHMTGQALANAGNRMGQLGSHLLVVFNLPFHMFKAFIEIFQNGVRQLAAGFVLLPLAQNAFDLIQIECHLFQTENHAQPQQLIAGITSKPTLGATFGLDQTHFFVKSHRPGGCTSLFGKPSNMY